ncbi:MAG TPA: N-acetylmuramoyl-L-alanine amidase [Butyricimonas sp.]|uniref:N-acetylmuramoyl-L-alanine amidase n=1 Tax=Butyricimonas sp. TaxID=1969738 RepID=UPI000EC61460|nr:N-acetylmuramoyl-L-alanine amidase [Butyricimonas sp.]HAM84455.1 N-acetylmuramoyl-L-alanine amidase [Butyricimonas sp.]HCH90777.1 N-acetylmuramoyl-L-alanine amidase [Butyricimonas sp.]
MDILNHRLVDCEAVHLTCSKNTRPLTAPDTIVLHYTAGSNGLASAYYLTRPDVAASAHLVIDRNGDIIQLVPFNVEAWHAGKSFHLGRVNLNHYSIGIELDNLGKLRREGEKFIAECGKEVQPSDVFVDEENGQPTYWHRYTDEQLKTVVLVCLLLMDRYPIRYLLRHSDITPRKIDPGPAFPREILELNR